MRLCIAIVVSVVNLPPTMSLAQPVRTDGVILHAVPLSVEAPGYHGVVRAFHDGKAFYVDISGLFELLGFTVSRRGAVVEALDVSRRYVVDFGQAVERETGVSLSGQILLSGAQHLVTIEGLSRLFASDIHFEEARLSLRLSTAAEKFNIDTVRKRTPLSSEAPGPVRFGRERPLWGGALTTYHMSWSTVRGPQGSIRFTGSVLGGALRGTVGRASTYSYLFDRPASRSLTQVEIGRLHAPYFQELPALDALRLSNIPLVRSHLQRSTTYRGRTDPHALVEATVSGLVVDRAQADGKGRYSLVVPTQYGSTEVLLKTQPLAAATRIERRLLFVSADLVEARKFYYDAFVGVRSGIVHAEYGLLPRVTVRGSGMLAPRVTRARFGIAASPLPFVVIGGEADVTGRQIRATGKLWHRNVIGDVVFGVFPQGREFRSQASISWGRWSGFLAASSLWRGEWRTNRISSSLSYHGRRGLSGGVRVSSERFGQSGHAPHRVLSYRLSAGQRAAAGGLTLFAQGLGNHVVRECGVEGFWLWRHVSVGLSVGYDTVLSDFTGGLSLRLDTPVGSIESRHSRRTHTLAAFGTLDMGPRPRLLRGGGQESAAVLRIFEDEDGDGVFDANERIMPEVEAQIYHAGLRREKDGALSAAYLEPYAAYQVQIIERSIRDPNLSPQAGYSFSFIADPGRSKTIDIPLSRPLSIKGTIEGLRRAPSRVRVAVWQGGAQVRTADVYRDGGFFLRLTAGRYTLRLTDMLNGDVLGAQPLVVAPGKGSSVVFTVEHPEEAE